MPDWTSLITGPQQASAQTQAAQTQANAQLAGQQLTYNMFEQQQATQLPWVQAGQSALAKQQTMQGQYPDLSTGAYQQSDYDKWVMSQGTNALMAGGAATGMYGSGNLGAALSDYGQNQAGSQYQQWRNNALGDYTNQYNMLAGMSGTGQVSAQNIGSQGAAAAQTMGQYGVGAGNALAAGQIGSSNAYANMFSSNQNSMMSGLGSYLNYNQNQQYMNAMGGQGGGYGGDSSYGYDPNYGGYNSWETGYGGGGVGGYDSGGGISAGGGS